MSEPTRVERLQAMRAARFAARRDMPATVCPYDPGSTDNKVRVLARVWVAEYLRVRPIPPGLLNEAAD